MSYFKSFDQRRFEDYYKLTDSELQYLSFTGQFTKGIIHDSVYSTNAPPSPKMHLSASKRIQKAEFTLDKRVELNSQSGRDIEITKDTPGASTRNDNLQASLLQEQRDQDTVINLAVPCENNSVELANNSE